MTESQPARSRHDTIGSAGVSPTRTNTGNRWRSRGYLPHLDRPGHVQMITFRLADALPAAVSSQIRLDPTRPTSARARRQLAVIMDSGHGSCHLRDPRIANLVEGTLFHHDGTKYHLLCWVVMPNHVHVLVETLPGCPLAGIVQGWKLFSAKVANRLLGCEGRFWQPEYFDRAIRDERHFADAVRYIHSNPVKAGLVRETAEWAFSSARRGYREPQAGEPPALPAFEPQASETLALPVPEPEQGEVLALPAPEPRADSGVLAKPCYEPRSRH